VALARPAHLFSMCLDIFVPFNHPSMSSGAASHESTFGYKYPPFQPNCSRVQEHRQASASSVPIRMSHGWWLSTYPHSLSASSSCRIVGVQEWSTKAKQSYFLVKKVEWTGHPNLASDHAGVGSQTSLGLFLFQQDESLILGPLPFGQGRYHARSR